MVSHTQKRPRHWLLCQWRLLRLLAYLAGMLFTALCIFPFANSQQRLQRQRRWGESILRIADVRIEAANTTIPAGALLVANHISWLDIPALSALFPCAYIAKAEIRQWPLIGRVTASIDSIFLERGSPKQARQANQQITHLLKTGRCVSVFPEGTTSDGSQVLRFHAALLQAALEENMPIVPVALSYWETAGEAQPDQRLRSQAAAYVGDTSLLQSVRSVLRCRNLILRVVVMPPLYGKTSADHAQGSGIAIHRRAVSEAARLSIMQGAGIA